MSQYDFGNLESPVSGTELINTHFEPWRDALHSMHKGSSRPSYAVAGMIWVDDTTTPWLVKMFDGSDDITLGQVDATSNWFKPSGTSIYAGSAGGTANAITLTPTIPLTSYAAGVVYQFLVTANSTSSTVTINISGLGTKNAKAFIGSGKVNVPKGAFRNGMIASVVYDGTDFQLLNVRSYNKGADIATASTINLDAATGDYVTLTGTTTVTAITLAEGQERTCHCSGIFTLTNGASLILPTGSDIDTAAGDVFVVRGESSGVVRVVNYMRADGSAVAGGGGLFTEQYESPAQTIVYDSNYTLSHGLSGTPKLVQAVVKCTSADAGFSVGDELMLNGNLFYTSNSLFSSGVATVATATQIKARINNNITVNNFSTSARGQLTPANWDLYFRAFY